eukprot:COSAG06_NODE_64806_length_258_cov_1.264151_1_plen_20_part_10
MRHAYVYSVSANAAGRQFRN